MSGVKCAATSPGVGMRGVGVPRRRLTVRHRRGAPTARPERGIARCFGFVWSGLVAEQFGDRDRSPLTAAGSEITTVARRRSRTTHRARRRDARRLDVTTQGDTPRPS